MQRSCHIFLNKFFVAKFRKKEIMGYGKIKFLSSLSTRIIFNVVTTCFKKNILCEKIKKICIMKITCCI